MTVHREHPHSRWSRRGTPARSWTGHGRQPAPGDDTGSVAVEIALSVPLGLLLIFLVAAAFHLGRASIDVNSAAAAAARAASLSRTAAAAVPAARSAADTTLAGHCTTIAVTVDTTRFRRGGTVTVTVTCTVTTRGLTGISMPGTVTTAATSTSPLDRYRGQVP